MKLRNKDIDLQYQLRKYRRSQLGDPVILRDTKSLTGHLVYIYFDQIEGDSSLPILEHSVRNIYRACFTRRGFIDICIWDTINKVVVPFEEFKRLFRNKGFEND